MNLHRIALDIRPLQNAYADHGVGTYVRNIVSRLVRTPLAPSLLLLGSAAASPFPGVAYRTLWRPRLRPWVWEQVLWPLDMIRFGVGTLHSMASLGPLRDIALPYACAKRTIATVYDLTSKRVSGLQAYAGTRTFRIQLAALTRARMVMVTSQAVRNDVIGMAGVRHDRVVVVPGAVDDEIRSIFDARAFPQTAGGRPYILAIGETANKNIATAVSVFERLAGTGFDGDLHVIGRKEEQSADVTDLLVESAVRDRIHFMGRISSTGMVAEYAGASLLLFPSLSEGFGFPVLEAMYCGTPVVASNTTSLPEVGGTTALYCAPGDIAGFAGRARLILVDAELRQKLRTEGRKRAESFSWDHSVGQLVKLYEQIGLHT